jgi:hypothetical protein
MPLKLERSGVVKLLMAAFMVVRHLIWHDKDAKKRKAK